jgi:hypothetical protein
MAMKPSEKEEEHFARLEFEKKKRLEEERQARMAAEEKQRLKELHYMHCPKCGMQLVEIDYKGIKIDRCTGCTGVWLDAGELEQVANLEHGGLNKFFSVFKK